MPGWLTLGLCGLLDHDFTATASEPLPSYPFPLYSLQGFFPPFPGPHLHAHRPAGGWEWDPSMGQEWELELQAVGHTESQPGCPGGGPLCLPGCVWAWGGSQAPGAASALQQGSEPQACLPPPPPLRGEGRSVSRLSPTGWE